MIEDIVRQLTEFSGLHDAKHDVVLDSSIWSSVDRGYIELRGDWKVSKFFVKMARFPNISSQIQREATTLKKLRDMQVKHVPEIVLDGSCEGRAFLVERFIEGVRLEDSNFSKAEKLRIKLDWLKSFYSATLQGEVEPYELIRRVEKVGELASDLADLSESLGVLESCKPDVKIPSVCWHGDTHAVNFLYSRDRTIAVDFGFSKFNEPPAEPYILVPPGTLDENAKDLDLLSLLGGVNPIFLAIYANAMNLGEQFRVRAEMEENILLVDQSGPINPLVLSKELENMKILSHKFNEFKK